MGTYFSIVAPIYSNLIFFQKATLAVAPGEVYQEAPWEKDKQAKQEFRLREKMVKNKHRNLYKSMKKGREERAKEAWLLKKKRRLIDEKVAKEKKGKKKNKPTKKA